MLTISVKGIEFFGYHGVTAEERKIGHRFRADIEAVVDSRADETDELSDTVDYGSLAAAAVEVSAAGSHRTIERLANLIACRIMEDHPKVQNVSVKVAKLLPPLPGVVAETMAEVVRSR